MTDARKRRAYSSPVREEQAARTRERILEAADALFTGEGYARTTVKAVAGRAGVAPDTVYAVFGSKARLLTAVVDRRLAPAGEENVMDRADALGVRDEPDQRRQLALFARDIATVVERVRPVYEVLRTASAVEPAMAEVHAEMDTYRLANMRRVVGWVADHGPLRVDVDRAAEIVWAVASPDVARLLRDGRGWTPEEYASWLEVTFVRALLPDADADGAGRR